MKAWVVFSLTLVVPLPAYALPTPDALISVANILPLLMGAAATALGSMYYGIRKILGPQAGGMIIGGVFGGFIVLFGVLVLTIYTWSEGNRTQRINNIAMYLRCDMSAHEAYLKWNAGNKGAKSKWKAFGKFKVITLREAEDYIRKQPDATLIATPQRSIQYHSGIPGIEVNGKVKLFDFVRAKALPDYLKKNVHTHDLYLHDFYRHYKRSPDKYMHDLEQMKVFEQFDHIYITRSKGANHRYVVEDSGGIREADPKGGTIAWPVRNEPWIIDGLRASFPEMLTLLSDDDAVDFVEDEDVFLVAPFNSFHRDSYIQIETYLERLLFDIPSERVLILDMNAPNVSDTLRRLALKLDGKKFMVIGLTKYDWVYDGLDVSFEMWERLGHNTERFKLLGFTTRLPEVSAIRFETRSSQGAVDFLRQPFWSTMAWLTTTLQVPMGLALVIFAVLLRLLFFPIGMMEARSRFMRSGIKHALSQNPPPLWVGSEQSLMHHLKVRGGWELLGTLVMLALILPAYSILSMPPAGVFEQSFLWVQRLDAPDFWLSLIVAMMIYVKIQVSGSSMKQITVMTMTALFAVLLLYLPSSLLLYVIGVLLVTTTQEFFALRYSQNLLNHALLKV